MLPTVVLQANWLNLFFFVVLVVLIAAIWGLSVAFNITLYRSFGTRTGSEPPEEKMNCPECGARILINQENCDYCGESVVENT